MVRERTIHAMRAVKLSSRFLQLDLTTQAGTYVKEYAAAPQQRRAPRRPRLPGRTARGRSLGDVAGRNTAHKRTCTLLE